MMSFFKEKWRQFSRKNAKKKLQKPWILIGLVTGLLVLVNLVLAITAFRVDVTRDHLFSLSKSSKRVISKLDKRVVLRFYCSEKLPPQVQVMRQTVMDVLREFQRSSHGHMSLEVRDPGEDPRTRAYLKTIGIPILQMNVIEKDKLEVMAVYSGLEVVYGDKSAVIPVVFNVQNLEYGLLSTLQRLIQPKRPQVVFLFNEGDRGANLSVIQEGVKADFDLKIGNPEDKIPDQTQTVAVIEPRAWTPHQVRRVMTLLKKGINVALFTPSVVISPDYRAFLGESGFESALLEKGLKLDNQLILDEANEHAAFSGPGYSYTMAYPFWIKISRSGFDLHNPVVAQLESVVLPWTTSLHPLTPSEKDGLGIPSSTTEHSAPIWHVLVNSSSKSWSMKPPFQIRPRELYDTPDLGSRPLVAFTDPLGEKVVDHKTVPAGRLIVAGNACFLHDAMVSRFPGNGVFFLNLLDWLGMGETMSDVRIKQVQESPLKTTSDKEKKWIKWSASLSAPLILGLWAWRRKITRKVKR